MDKSLALCCSGATGRVGQGVLRECLLDAQITEVFAVGRSTTGQQHPKLHEVIHKDFTDYSTLELRKCHRRAFTVCVGWTARPDRVANPQGQPYIARGNADE